MRKIILYIMLLCLSALRLPAQSTLDTVLKRIERNNKDIRAEQQRVAAVKAGYKTGLTLYDPQVSIDYLKGYPATAGNQTDLLVSQGFDFPTAYGFRKKVAGLKSTQTGYEGARNRQEIMLEAKLASLRLVYLNKRESLLLKRQAEAETFYRDYERKYELKDATILDLNKARLQLANIRTDLRLVQAGKKQFTQQLTALNGGKPVIMEDTAYPPQPALPVLDTLEQTIEAVDPTLRMLQAQQSAGEAEVRLSKALRLPKLEAGYRYQGILGQRFHGGHFGLSIPLWENRNKVNAQQERARWYESQVEAHRTEHYNEVKELYEKYSQLKDSYILYGEELGKLSSEDLLKKSLKAGQITTLEYFMEQTLFYESQDRYLEIEAELQRTVAELLKYSL
ncbi:TolC family protein [Chitinophaga cymbidii]|uniref:Transporter n=1 Tax=Chitinophaga cymbidii TaxID=1096750 RepID=A0A512RPX6_9BACT|nr:TolC family protein [Chitinophaga cymbidii]GEP97749.1 transporter [Chitinophaga cymbidii]